MNFAGGSSVNLLCTDHYDRWARLCILPGLSWERDSGLRPVPGVGYIAGKFLPARLELFLKPCCWPVVSITLMVKSNATLCLVLTCLVALGALHLHPCNVVYTSKLLCFMLPLQSLDALCIQMCLVWLVHFLIRCHLQWTASGSFRCNRSGRTICYCHWCYFSGDPVWLNVQFTDAYLMVG